MVATWPELSERFLYRLRFATVVECRPTTKLDELARVAGLCGIERDEFVAAYHGPAAQGLLRQDLALKEQLRIYGLPAFVMSYGGRGTLLHGVPTYEQLEQAIEKVSEGSVRPCRPEATPEELRMLLDGHPLISLLEVTAAFGLESDREALDLAKPLLETGAVHLVDAPKGRFLANQ